MVSKSNGIPSMLNLQSHRAHYFTIIHERVTILLSYQPEGSPTFVPPHLENYIANVTGILSSKLPFLKHPGFVFDLVISYLA